MTLAVQEKTTQVFIQENYFSQIVRKYVKYVTQAIFTKLSHGTILSLICIEEKIHKSLVHKEEIRILQGSGQFNLHHIYIECWQNWCCLHNHSKTS